MIIRDARQSDNKALLKLTALTSMQGDIGLRIKRSPDFFALINDRGPFIILVAEQDNEILGCIAVSSQPNFCSMLRFQSIIFVILGCIRTFPKPGLLFYWFAN